MENLNGIVINTFLRFVCVFFFGKWSCCVRLSYFHPLLVCADLRFGVRVTVGLTGAIIKFSLANPMNDVRSQ